MPHRHFCTLENVYSLVYRLTILRAVIPPFLLDYSSVFVVAYTSSLFVPQIAATFFFVCYSRARFMVLVYLERQAGSLTHESSCIFGFREMYFCRSWFWYESRILIWDTYFDERGEVNGKTILRNRYVELPDNNEWIITVGSQKYTLYTLRLIKCIIKTNKKFHF